MGRFTPIYLFTELVTMQWRIFGKLPSYGDFVRHNMPSVLRDLFEHWTLTSFEALQQQMGHAWKQTYAKSPIWHFALASSTLTDDHSVAGVMAASVDMAGRCYPFIVLGFIKSALNPFSLMRSLAAYHDDVELLLNTLVTTAHPHITNVQRGDFSPSKLLSQFTDIYQSFSGDHLTSVPMSAPKISQSSGVLTDVLHTDITRCHESLLERLSMPRTTSTQPISIWYTGEKPSISARQRYLFGLPSPDMFYQFLLEGEH